MKCEQSLSGRWYLEENARCSFHARMMAPDGKILCRTHAQGVDGCVRIDQAFGALREFYQAATANGMCVEAVHSYDCPATLMAHQKKFGPCNCGMGAVQDRVDTARRFASSSLSRLR